ncbi:MAG: hypothetical protein EBX37_03260 [Alphaproteobacteria bacterium]|nr:hypothetical protein [Alphaproteobacteria bacterium]
MSSASSINLSSLNGTTGFRLDGVSAGDQSGWSVASAGDVNGDGFADIILGAYQANQTAGAIYLLFGKAGGFTASLNLSTLDGSNGLRLDGWQANTHTAWSVASAGDVNGDGYADMIIGAHGTGGTNATNYVVFGQSAGFASAINLSGLNGSNGFQIGGGTTADLSRILVASAGDVNGDGFADLLLGDRDADPNGLTNAGSSYVVFGKASGFASAFALSSIDGRNGFRLNGAAAGDQIGYFVASAGDMNGDGFADLILGAPQYTGGVSGPGSAYVVLGKASGFAATINVSSLNGSNGFKMNGVNTGDAAGVFVSSAGDVNGDGFADVILGAPFTAPNGATNAGSSYVVFGKSGGFGSAINLASLNGSTGFRLDGVSRSDNGGYRPGSAGDFNGDGYADLLIGAPHANGSAGAGYVFYGKASGFASAINLSSLNGSNGFKLNGVSTNDFAGFALASAGDVNGDGHPDLIIGAFHADPNAAADAGSSYVYFSPASGGATNRGTSLADTQRGTAYGDTINGNGGNDSITGGGGNDTIDGGAGDDTIIWALGDGNDTITLGAGNNILDLGKNAFTYRDEGAQRVFTIGSATVTVNDWSAGTNSVICILPGTLITTPDGERPIETLTMGDIVTTPEGPRSIRWVGRSSHSMVFLRGKPMCLPIRIHAGALGEGLPLRDLWVSPWHAVLFGETLVRAFDLINGQNITQDFQGPAAHFYNIELDSPDIIFAEGAPVETYANHNNRAMFHNLDEYLALYGSHEPSWVGPDGAGIRRHPLLAENAPELAPIRQAMLARARKAAA